MVNISTFNAAIPAAFEVPEAQRLPVCPLCASNTKVVRIRDLHNRTLTSRSEVDLARQFSPVAPFAFSRAGLLVESAAQFLAIAFIGVLFFGAVLLELILSNSPSAELFPWPLFLIPLGLGLIVVLVRMMIVWRRMRRAEYAFQRITARWNSAYFCRSDDIVFNPSESRWWLRVEFNEYLSA